MVYLYIFGGVLVLLLLYMRFEAGFLEVCRINFTSRKKGLKIIQLSDIHVNLLRVRVSRVKRVILHEKPDLLLITGDFIETPKNIGLFMEFLCEIKQNVPTYLCFGNHDYKAFKKNRPGIDEFIELIEATGTIVLHNQSASIIHNNKKYNISGIADLREGNPDIADTLAGRSQEAFANLAISHNPDIILEMPRGSADYMFCGHFHGGQIWAPFNLEYKLLRKDKLCKKGIKKGLHKVNGINLYINRGLGNVLVPLRLFSRPEITVFMLP